MSSTSKILVFGGAGFIGTNLLARLSGETDQKLVSIDIKHPKKPIPGVEYLTGDVRDLNRFDVSGTVDQIYNLAAVHTTPGHEAHEYYDTNVAGATQITAFARRKGVTSILFTSSISVYGPGEDVKSENSVPMPATAYGWSKLLAEGIHRAWVEEDVRRQLVVCRPAVIFGPGEGGNFTRLASLLKRGYFIYPGRKDTIKACFYVDDLVDSLLYAKNQNRHFILMNACYPDRYTLEQIVNEFRKTYYPDVRAIKVPLWLLYAAAALLRPFSMLGLGIHPDRVMKLVRSTDINPSWLETEGKARPGQLSIALERWYRSSNGQFC